MNLRSAEEGKEYIVKRIETDDEDLNSFLFSLGCYSGEPITVISRKKHSGVVSIQDGRYSIDNALAEAIIIWKIIHDDYFFSGELAAANYIVSM